MHETGLVYIPTFELVGISATHFKDWNQEPNEEDSKSSLAHSLAMGLEPSGVAAQKCSDFEVPEKAPVWSYKFIACVAVFMVVCMFCGRFTVRRVMQWISALDERFRRLENDVNAA
eukprot:s2167_g12.t1